VGCNLSRLCQGYKCIGGLSMMSTGIVMLTMLRTRMTELRIADH
jgi:hypothetical protein